MLWGQPPQALDRMEAGLGLRRGQSRDCVRPCSAISEGQCSKPRLGEQAPPAGGSQGLAVVAACLSGGLWPFQAGSGILP